MGLKEKKINVKLNMIFNPMFELRDLLFGFLLIWLINPQSMFSKVYNWNLYGVVLLIWIALAFASDQKSFLHALLDDGIYLIWLFPICLFIFSCFGVADFSIKQFTTPFIFIYFAYYSKTEKSGFLKLSIFLVVIYILLITINTYFANLTNPQLSRILAHGDLNNTYSISSPFIANFAFCYSLTGIAIMIIGCVKIQKSLIKKILFIIAYLWMVIILVSVEYVLALIGTLFFSFWVVFMYTSQKENFSKNFLKLFVTCFLLVVIYLMLPKILSSIYSYVNGDNLKFRIGQVLQVLDGEKNLITLGRPKLYYASISTWISSIENFMFGVGYYVGEDVVGGHSSLFDTFARYGAVGGFAWLLTIIPAMKHVVANMDIEEKKLQKIIFALLIYQGIVNPIYYDLLLIIFFFVIPELLRCFLTKKSGDFDDVEQIEN